MKRVGIILALALCGCQESKSEPAGPQTQPSNFTMMPVDGGVLLTLPPECIEMVKVQKECLKQ